MCRIPRKKNHEDLRKMDTSKTMNPFKLSHILCRKEGRLFLHGTLEQDQSRAESLKK